MNNKLLQERQRAQGVASALPQGAHMTDYMVRRNIEAQKPERS